jgi:aminotransferase in exopolysaccharide biosynthesis
MILLSAPNIAGNEWSYIKDCLDTGWVSSVGSYVTRFEESVAEYTGARYAVACVNGTNALHIALMLNGVGAGDLVIVPNITFIASVNAIRYCGAAPVLIDVDPENWQMDEQLLARFLHEECDRDVQGNTIHRISGKRVAALLPVHVLGNVGELDKICALASGYGLPIVEDATESLGSFYQGKHTGTFGNFGCFSFNGNKIITTGGGGMMVTNDEHLAKRARHLTTQAKSDPFEYVHDEIGYNYRMVNLLAAMGLAQMEQLNGFIEAKKKINAFYRNALKGIGDIAFQKIPEAADINFWLFTFRTAERDRLLEKLNASGIQSRPFWKPMNQLPMFAGDIYYSDNDVSGEVYKSCVSIPSSTFLTENELSTIAEAIKKHFDEIL